MVGLDIEAGSAAATELVTNGSVEIGGTGIASLGPSVTREGEIADPEDLGSALKELFAEHKLGQNVRVGIANQRVIVRTMRLPLIENRDELETAIRFQAPDKIAMPLEQAVIDWQVLDPDPETVAARQMDVVVVAARRETVSALTSAIRAAGLKPVGIDVSAFGMIRALAHELPAIAAPQQPSYEERSHDGGEQVAPAQPARLYCNLGDITNLAVARGTSCLFTRISSFGVEGIAQRLAERRELTLEHARQWLGHVGLKRPLEEIEGDPEILSAARDVLTEGVQRLAGELRMSLDFYGAQEGAVAIEEVVACGAGTAIEGLIPRLGVELGYPLRVGRPAALASLDEPSAARLTLSYGLALEQ